MKARTRWLAALLALLLCLSPMTVWASPEAPQAGHVVNLELSDTAESQRSFQEEVTPLGYQKEDWVTVIVELEEAPLLDGQVRREDLRTASCQAKAQRLQDTHRTLQAQIRRLPQTAAQAASHEANLLYEYTTIFNGFAMEMCYGDLEALRALPGVKSAHVATRYDAPTPVETGLEPLMAGSTEGIGSDVVNAMGYDGRGKKVAILDTGLDTAHEAFSEAPQEQAMTLETLKAQMDQVELHAKLDGAEDVYVSGKIPYAYDYGSGQAGAAAVQDTSGHGTHVAGTVAGSCSELQGVAPNAQLLILKVTSPDGSILDSTILAALEDAVLLGADSVNMSLGASAGFGDTRETAVQDAYYRCAQAGVSLMIAAGNDRNSAVGNRYGNSLPLAESPDSALVSTPSTSFAAMSVASVENFKVTCSYMKLGQTEILFQNGVDNGSGQELRAAEMICGGEKEVTLPYVMVPGLGAPEDYEGLDVAGKIAVVQRGVLGFSEKANYAAAAGAVGCILYNNQAGSLVPGLAESVSIGTVGISLEDGQKLEQAEEKLISFSPDWVDYRAMDTCAKPSDFSDWGPTPDLQLKPEMAAPGGNISSAKPGGGYQLMSGTSMACPHMAGAAAVVRQYLEEELGMTDSSQIHDLTDALLMSTARPAVREDGSPYSPRQQGAGVLNLKDAVTTKAYLSVDGCDRPKAELGESGEGRYAFTFRVHNLGQQALSYTPNFNSVMEGVVEDQGHRFIDMVTRSLQEGTDYTVTYEGLKQGKLTVPAGGEAVCTVTLALTESRKEQILKDFPNGNYVEGYVSLTPEGEGVTLGLPYLGFYADWEQAPLFDGTPDGDYYMSPTQLLGASTDYFGVDYLGTSFDGTYDNDKLAFSADYNGEGNRALALLLGLRRNAVDLKLSVLDPDGSVMWEYDYDRAPKNFFSSNSGGITLLAVWDGWNGCLADGTYAPEGQGYIYRLTGGVGQSQVTQTMDIPFFLDHTAPKATDFTLVEEDGRYILEFLVQDNHYVNYIQLGDSTSQERLALVGDGFQKITEPGLQTKVRIDITNYGDLCAKKGLNPARITVYTTDYAGNISKNYVEIGPRAITLENLHLDVGATAQVAYTIHPDKLQSIPLTWTSADESIAVVNEAGQVTGLRNGSVTVSATAASGLTASCRITVGTGIANEELQNHYGETPYLNDRFQAGDFWYKVTGPDTVQLTRDPGSSWSSYPELSGDLVIPAEVTYEGILFRVTSIGESAFSGNNDITAVTLPDTMEIIGQSAFSSCYGLEITHLPDSIRRLDDQAFQNSSGVNCNLPTSLEAIGSSVFSYTGLTEAIIPATVKRLGSEAFSGCYSLKRAVFQGLPEELGEEIFAYDAALEEVVLPQGMTAIPKKMFQSCSKLTRVEIPETVLSIGDSAFAYAGLTSFVIPEACREIGMSAFAYTGSREILIPDQVERVEDYAFSGCRNVETVVFGKSVSYIGTGVMDYIRPAEGLEAVHIEVISEFAASALFSSGYHGVVYKDGLPYVVYTGLPFMVDGVVYQPTSDRTVMVTSCYRHQGEEIVIPETVYSEDDDMTYTVTGIARSGMYRAKGRVTLPETVTMIGDRGLADTGGLTSVNLPQGLTVIRERAFSSMGQAETWADETLTVPGSVGTFGDGAFSASHYRRAILGEGITQISAEAFDVAYELEEIQLPSTLRQIGKGAFRYCSALKSIQLPEALERVEKEAFYCSNLGEITIPDHISYIGSQAFVGNTWDENYNQVPTGPKQVWIGSGLRDLGWNVFRKDAAITTVLNSQRNLCVTFGDLERVPEVLWDGKTEIALGDGSCVPAGKTVTVTGDIVIDGKLTIEGKLIVEPNATLTITENAVIVGEENIEYKTCDGGEGCCSKTFTDLNTYAWYHAYTDYVIARGLMNGMSATRFAPDAQLTRGMLVTTLYRLAGEPEVTEAATFTDVAADKYYTDAIAWAEDQGIAQGMGGGKFAPNGAVTREQGMTFLYRYVVSVLGEEPGKNGDLSIFRDAGKISNYAKEAMAWGAAAGLLEGYGDGTVGPKNSVTRAQMAKFLTILSKAF